MRRFPLIQAYWKVLAAGFVMLLIGYLLGNLLPFKTDNQSSRLAYVSNGYVHLHDLQTGNDINIGSVTGEGHRNVVSPDGSVIASLTNLEGPRWSLALLDTVQWQRTEIFEFQGAFPTLAWSPDGHTLAYGAISEGREPEFNNSELFLLDVTTLETQQLTDNDYRDDSPSFSPDGKQLAYTSSADGFNRLYILDIATKASRRVTDQAFGYVPVWSPDGQQIAFSSNHEEFHNQVYMINTDGTNLRRVSFTTATDDFPFWMP